MGEENRLAGLFGDAVRARRLDLGLTQEDLAKRVGVSTPTVGAIESGQGSMQTQKLFPVLEFLGLDEPLKWILAGEANPHRRRARQSTPAPEITTGAPTYAAITVQELEAGALAETPELRIGRDTHGDYSTLPMGHTIHSPDSSAVAIEGGTGTGKTELLKMIAYSLVVADHSVTVIDTKGAGEWDWIHPYAALHVRPTADQLQVLITDRRRLTLDAEAAAPVFIVDGVIPSGTDTTDDLWATLRSGIRDRHQGSHRLRFFIGDQRHTAESRGLAGNVLSTDGFSITRGGYPEPPSTERGSLYRYQADTDATHRIIPFEAIPTATLTARLRYLYSFGPVPLHNRLGRPSLGHPDTKKLDESLRERMGTMSLPTPTESSMMWGNAATPTREPTE